MVQRLLDAIHALTVVAEEHGIQNIFQPGLAKELVIASILGHHNNTAKHGPDARSAAGHIEYLTAREGGSVQLDRMLRAPCESRARSLKRITRNEKIYAVFMDKKHAVKPLRIYELDIPAFLKEVERQMDASKLDITHVGVQEKWVQQHGALIWPVTV